MGPAIAVLGRSPRSCLSGSGCKRQQPRSAGPSLAVGPSGPIERASELTVDDRGRNLENSIKFCGISAAD